MSKSTFDYICIRLEKHLKPKENIVRPSTASRKKVAIALYKLASCGEYRVIANQFGTQKSVVQQYIYKFCEAVIAEFSKDFLSFLNENDTSELAQGFENLCGIPNIIGAIDGTHIPILAPKIGYRDYVNRKGWPSYNALAIVDHLYRFRYIVCKHPGCSHDAAVLRDSALYKNAEEIIPKKMFTVDGTNVLLGDPAYPLLPWLLKGYKGNVSPEEDSFNVYHSRGRVVVENGFGRLKARFRCLLKRIDINYKFVPKVVACCIILHNIIESRKETFVQNWLEEMQSADVLLPQPPRNITRDFDTLEGSEIINVIKLYVTTRFPLLSSKLH